MFLSNYFAIVPELQDIAVQWRAVPFMLFYSLGSLVAALMADRWGTLVIMRWSAYMLFILGLCHIVALLFGVFHMSLALLTVVLLACFQAPAFVSLFERIAAPERCQSIALGHAIGSCLFSGSAPIISLWLWHKTQWMLAPFVYFMFLLGLGFLGLFLLQQEKMKHVL